MTRCPLCTRFVVAGELSTALRLGVAMNFLEWLEAIGCPVDVLDRGDMLAMRSQYDADMRRLGFPALPRFVELEDARIVAERNRDLLDDLNADRALEVKLAELGSL